MGGWEGLRCSLAQMKDYPGVTGKTGFPLSRDAEKDLLVLTVKDGRIIQVK